jgi:tRNA (cmo5U34)-methyltransferase
MLKDGKHFPANPASFKFDAEVAEVFDDMARRSIPGYVEAHHVMGRMVERLPLPEFSEVWDFGVSTGTGLATVAASARTPLLYYRGCDVSEPMLDKARVRLEQDFNLRLKLVKHDLTFGLPETLTPGKLGVGIFAWTLQFLPCVVTRERLIIDAYRALVPGGALFIMEKFWLADTPLLDEVAQARYMRWRMDNGYTVEEIEAKTAALKHAMWPWQPYLLTELLTRLGAKWEWTYRTMNFGGVVAVKPHTEKHGG